MAAASAATAFLDGGKRGDGKRGDGMRGGGKRGGGKHCKRGGGKRCKTWEEMGRHGKT